MHCTLTREFAAIRADAPLSLTVISRSRTIRFALLDRCNSLAIIVAEVVLCPLQLPLIRWDNSTWPPQSVVSPKVVRAVVEVTMR